jgi:hypothetical protein
MASEKIWDKKNPEFFQDFGYECMLRVAFLFYISYFIRLGLEPRTRTKILHDNDIEI